MPPADGIYAPYTFYAKAAILEPWPELLQQQRAEAFCRDVD